MESEKVPNSKNIDDESNNVGEKSNEAQSKVPNGTSQRPVSMQSYQVPPEDLFQLQP